LGRSGVLDEPLSLSTGDTSIIKTAVARDSFIVGIPISGDESIDNSLIIETPWTIELFPLIEALLRGNESIKDHLIIQTSLRRHKSVEYLSTSTNSTNIETPLRRYKSVENLTTVADCINIETSGGRLESIDLARIETSIIIESTAPSKCVPIQTPITDVSSRIDNNHVIEASIPEQSGKSFLYPTIGALCEVDIRDSERGFNAAGGLNVFPILRGLSRSQLLDGKLKVDSSNENKERREEGTVDSVQKIRKVAGGIPTKVLEAAGKVNSRTTKTTTTSYPMGRLRRRHNRLQDGTARGKPHLDSIDTGRVGASGIYCSTIHFRRQKRGFPPITKESMRQLQVETGLSQHRNDSSIPKPLATIETITRTIPRITYQNVNECESSKGGEIGRAATIFKSSWPSIIIERRYAPFSARAYESRTLRFRFFDNFLSHHHRFISDTLSMIDISPTSFSYISYQERELLTIETLIHATIETVPKFTIETVAEHLIETVAAPKIRIDPLLAREHINITVYEMINGKFERMPVEWGWLAFNQVVREDGRNVMKTKADGLWKEEFDQYQILSVLGCGPYVLIHSCNGFYLAWSNFTKIGLLSKHWLQAVPMLTTIETLEERLTTSVDDFKLLEHFDNIETLGMEKCSEDYSFTDTSFEYSMESVVDEEEEEEADECLLDGKLDISE